MTEQSSSQTDAITTLVDRIERASLEIEEVVRPMANIEGERRQGGVFALMDEHGELLGAWSAGHCTSDETNRFRQNAMNKCVAMHENDVICSGMVADPTAMPPIYDGGIMLQNGWFFAFSGFPAEIDRAMCMIIARDVDLLDDARWNAILWKAPNHALVRILITEMAFGIASHLVKQKEVA